MTPEEVIAIEGEPDEDWKIYGDGSCSLVYYDYILDYESKVSFEFVNILNMIKYYFPPDHIDEHINDDRLIAKNAEAKYDDILKSLIKKYGKPDISGKDYSSKNTICISAAWYIPQGRDCIEVSFITYRQKYDDGDIYSGQHLSYVFHENIEAKDLFEQNKKHDTMETDKI